MDTRQSKVVLITMVAVAALWLLSPVIGTRRSYTLNAGDHVQFDSTRALRNTSEFVTQHPSRVIGSIESRQSSGLLQKRFQELGYAVSYAHFNAVVASRKQVGRNIYAFKPGRSQEIIAVMAHYDTAGTTLQGAMDDGSGVGVLLELARIMASRPLQRGILFVASDGEEWGMLGARELAANYPERGRIAAALSLDYVAIGDLAGLSLETAGQGGGYTPPWLRALARSAVEPEGLPLYEPYGFTEHLQRALPFSWTDQGPLVQAGIPAINLGSYSRDPDRELAVYHSPQDSIANMKAESFKPYGQAAERILLELDRMAAIPREPMESLRAVGSIYLPSPIVLALQCLAFVPVAVIAWFHLANHGRYISTGRVQRELTSYLATLTPFLLAWTALFVLVRLRKLPGYSIYPATPKDPVLLHPDWGAISWIAGTALVAGLGLYFLLKYLHDEAARPDFFVSKSINVVLFLVLIVLAMLYNPYWAATFLLLPAWIWSMVGPGKGYGGRAANRIILAAAGILYFMISCSFAEHLCIGWRLFWYQILAVSSGAISLQGYLLSVAVLALGVRFLAIQSHGASGD